MNSKILTIAILALLWTGCVAAVSADEYEYEGIVPPAEYFTTDGPMNGLPIHDGTQLGHVWYFTEEARYRCFGGGDNYLGITEYKLQISHAEQEWVAFGQKYYHCSMPDYPYVPYVPDKTGVSEDPAMSEYITPAQQHAGMV